ncbi:MAG: cbb3-type cytochrome oxidase assembly protein CcoS [Bacteroidetes bacterium]|nr:cbb3-type cytochrome oxidase assembly protein CcoS [Bacteroidota bacterium]MBS1672181.1 cbb3-type cytochrome oxidase assembly protein CcoS [Bacteroidota bacterium]
MGIFIIIALISLCIAGGFLLAFLWSVKDGQYDDIYSPPNRILFDNNQPTTTSSSSSETNQLSS